MRVKSALITLCLAAGALCVTVYVKPLPERFHIRYPLAL